MRRQRQPWSPAELRLFELAAVLACSTFWPHPRRMTTTRKQSAAQLARLDDAIALERRCLESATVALKKARALASPEGVVQARASIIASQQRSAQLEQERTGLVHAADEDEPAP